MQHALGFLPVYQSGVNGCTWHRDTWHTLAIHPKKIVWNTKKKLSGSCSA
jgi:hypothetical protein